MGGNEYALFKSGIISPITAIWNHHLVIKHTPPENEHIPENPRLKDELSF